MSKKSTSVDRNKGVLAATGLRVTNQRAIILDIIKRSDTHLDADEIHRRARRKEPRISLSTVYRSLQRFKDIGLVEVYHFDEYHHHYEAKPTETHHHLVCLGCGRIIEFDYDLVQQIEENVPEAREFSITGTELHINGYCAECRDEKV
jgi:Fe2+ or Zn2+ uptake regulation protein